MNALPKPTPYELLSFYVEAGVDETIGSVAVNRFVKPAPKPPSLSPTDTPPAAAKMVAAPKTTTAALSLSQTTAELAARCQSLEQLRQAMEAFKGASVGQTALTTVFAQGNPQSPVMLIGEAPGYEEDVQGLPFVGKSGKMLDRMLASIGLSRQENAYITNVMPWRPLDNRTPSAEEIAVCRPFLMRHIALQAPHVIVLLGGVPASTVLENPQGITRLRGQWVDLIVPGLSVPIPALPTFHPSYLLRTPAAKRAAWADLRSLRGRLTALTSQASP